MEQYLKRIELPDGQWATLLTRLPTDRAQMVRVASARESQSRGKGIRGGDPVFTEAVARAHLWEASLVDYLTGDKIGAADYGKADPRVTDTIQAEAFALYIEWTDEAYPGPKGSTPPPDSPTPTTEEAEASTTSGQKQSE